MYVLLVRKRQFVHMQVFQNNQIQENKLTSDGQKKIHIQVLNPYDEIIGIKKTAQINNTSITYSDQVIVNYNKEALNVVSFIETERENIEAGEYSVNTYINGEFITSSNFTIN